MATILIIDPSESERARIHAALSSLKGVDILEHDSAQSASTALFEQRVDLVLVDLTSAGDSEWELLGKLKLHHPKLPTVLLTTNGPDQEATVESLRMGAASYIPKSILARDLVVTVERLLTLSGCRRLHSRLNDCLERTGAEFVIENNDRSLVPVLVEKVMETAEDFGIAQNGKRMQIGVAVEEALNNAIVHGNLEIPTALREQDADQFHSELAERPHQEPYRDRQIRVKTSFSETECKITVRDDGQGFDPREVSDPTKSPQVQQPYGRGLFLIRAFMDEVHFNDSGNQITMIKRRPGEAPGAAAS